MFKNFQKNISILYYFRSLSRRLWLWDCFAVLRVCRVSVEKRKEIERVELNRSSSVLLLSPQRSECSISPGQFLSRLLLLLQRDWNLKIEIEQKSKANHIQFSSYRYFVPTTHSTAIFNDMWKRSRVEQNNNIKINFIFLLPFFSIQPHHITTNRTRNISKINEQAANMVFSSRRIDGVKKATFENWVQKKKEWKKSIDRKYLKWR